MWETPKRTKLSDRPAVRFARDIVAQRLKPRDALRAESDLAGRYGLSKVVARESLQTLVSAGLLYVQQGKRTVVLPDSEWNPIMPVVQHAFWLEGRAAEFIMHLYEIRRVLEAKSVEWAEATPRSTGSMR
jgi:DNA-binding FadR family transcriptional regulator